MPAAFSVAEIPRYCEFISTWIFTTNRPRDLAPHASAAEARGDEHQQATGWPGAGASIRSARAGTPAAQGPAGYPMCATVGARAIACGCVWTEPPSWLDVAPASVVSPPPVDSVPTSFPPALALLSLETELS